jgi:hypothetical protein
MACALAAGSSSLSLNGMAVGRDLIGALLLGGDDSVMDAAKLSAFLGEFTRGELLELPHQKT